MLDLQKQLQARNSRSSGTGCFRRPEGNPCQSGFFSRFPFFPPAISKKAKFAKQISEILIGPFRLGCGRLA